MRTTYNHQWVKNGALDLRGWFEAGGWICVTLGRGVSAYVVAMVETIGNLSRDRYSLHLLFLPRLLAHLVVKFVLIFNTFFIFVRGYAHFCCILEHAKLFFSTSGECSQRISART